MDRAIDPKEGWLNKLFKLLPAEYTGVFLGVRTLAPPDQIPSDINVFIFSLILLITLPFFNYFFLKLKDNLKQNVVICVSFVIWVLNIEILRLNRGSIQQFFVQTGIDVNFWVPAALGLWVVILIPLVIGTKVWETGGGK